MEISFNSVQYLRVAMKPDWNILRLRHRRYITRLFAFWMYFDLISKSVQVRCDHLSRCKETAARLFTKSESFRSGIKLDKERLENEKKALKNQLAIDCFTCNIEIERCLKLPNSDYQRQVFLALFIFCSTIVGFIM